MQSSRELPPVFTSVRSDYSFILKNKIYLHPKCKIREYSVPELPLYILHGFVVMCKILSSNKHHPLGGLYHLIIVRSFTNNCHAYTLNTKPDIVYFQ